MGQPINVSLLYDSENEFGREALFDNVSLSDAPDTPEPGSVLLVALGGLLILTRMHRSRRYNRAVKSVR